MIVETQEIKIAETKAGEITVTAKSGFAIRVSLSFRGDGFHIEAGKLGDDLQIWTAGRKIVNHGKKHLVTVYEVKPKVNTA